MQQFRRQHKAICLLVLAAFVCIACLVQPLTAAPVSIPTNSAAEQQQNGVESSLLDELVPRHQQLQRPAMALGETERLRKNLRKFISQWQTTPFAFAASQPAAATSAGGHDDELSAAATNNSAAKAQGEPAMIVAANTNEAGVKRSPSFVGPLRYG